MKWVKHPTLAGLLSLLWLAAMIGLYYVSHKPFSPALAASLVVAVWRLCVALAITSVGGGLGRRIVPLPGVHPLARLALQAALGLGLLSLGALLVGVTIGVSLAVVALSLAVTGGLLLKDILRWWGDWRGLRVLLRESDGAGRAIGLGAGLILLCTLATALAPPIKYDALVYHLVLPHAYIDAGRIIYVPWNMFWGMPQAGEMLYTWAILLGGDPSAAALGWMFGVLACVGLVGYAAGRLGNRAAWVGLAAFLSGATIALALGWGYVDWLAALFGLAFLVAMGLWVVEGERRFVWLAGAFAGLAVGAKYTAGVLIIAGLASVVWFGWRKGSRALPACVFQFLLIAGLAASPWIVKNFLATGNPLYPFLFPSGAMDALRLDLYQNQPSWAAWRDYLLLPWQATLAGVEGKVGYSASIGPLLFGLGLVGMASLAVRTRAPARVSPVEPGADPASSQRQLLAAENAAVIVVSGLLVWAAAGWFSAYLLQSRLYVALFPAAALLAAVGFSSLAQVSWSGVRFGRLAEALVLLVFWFNSLEVSLSALNEKPVSALLGVETTQAYLEDNLGWYIRAMQSVRALRAETRVLMLWEPRSLYCAPKCIPDEVLDRWLREQSRVDEAPPASSAATLQSWREEGYTHLLYYRLGADFQRDENAGRYRPEDWQALDSLLYRLPRPEDFGGDYLLYSLVP